jgi:hypothetical protein
MLGNLLEYDYGIAWLKVLLRVMVDDVGYNYMIITLRYDHSVVCPSIYGFSLPLCYFQTLFTEGDNAVHNKYDKQTIVYNLGYSGFFYQ